MRKINFTENQLREFAVEYCQLGKSASDIAKNNSCSVQTIIRQLKEYNIVIRDTKNAANMPLRINKVRLGCMRDYGFTKNELVDLYCGQGLSTRDIGNIYGCTQKVVIYRLTYWGIPIRKLTEAYNMPLRLSRVGNIWRNKGFMKGKQFSNEHRYKLKLAKKRYWLKYLGDNPRIRTEYTDDFSDSLKEKVRERDGYLCQLCGVSQNGKNHPVHHIDYIKYHNTMDNLVTLCSTCHRKVNGRRLYWEIYFKKYLQTCLNI